MSRRADGALLRFQCLNPAISPRIRTYLSRPPQSGGRSRPRSGRRSARIGPHERALARHRSRVIAAGRRHGARNLRVFGSIARGQERDESDVDLLVDLEPTSGSASRTSARPDRARVLPDRDDSHPRAGRARHPPAQSKTSSKLSATFSRFQPRLRRPVRPGSPRSSRRLPRCRRGRRRRAASACAR